MDEAALRDIERNVVVGRTLWADRYALDTLAALVAEVRRLRERTAALEAENARLRTAPLTIADDTNDIATYWAICDLIGEEPPSPEPRPRP